MYSDKKVLAVLCARGGSKGVKNKNIRSLAGRPLIAYSLDILSNAEVLDAYVISTDSEEIMNVVREHGYRVDFKRPAELAGDKVGRVDVVRHAVKWIENANQTRYDVIVDIGVATPLKTALDFDAAVRLLVDKGTTNILAVRSSERNPYYNMVELLDGQVRIVKQPPGPITDRRDAPKTYDMNDAFNVWYRDALEQKVAQCNSGTLLYEMPAERSVDIDEEVDLRIAEAYLGLQKEG